MELKDKFSQFQDEFIEIWGEYKKLDDELNLYRGKEIGDDADRVNEIVYELQKAYHTMYPALRFIIENHANTVKIIQGYNKFIEDIQKAGAVEITEIKS